jgi:hypothetical protein
MKTGDVFEWVTTKARGHQVRTKWHVYICASDWADDELFLYICSDNYLGDFEIQRSECNFLQKNTSYISCRAPIFYTDDELAAFKPRKIGVLSPPVLRRLHGHVAASITLEQRYILKIGNALRPFIK